MSDSPSGRRPPAIALAGARNGAADVDATEDIVGHGRRGTTTAPKKSGDMNAATLVMVPEAESPETTSGERGTQFVLGACPPFAAEALLFLR
jgi:hypothetical protein